MGKQGNKDDKDDKKDIEFSENKRTESVKIKNSGRIILEGVPDWLVYKKDPQGFVFSLKRDYNEPRRGSKISFCNSAGKVLDFRRVSYKTLAIEANSEANKETKKEKITDISKNSKEDFSDTKPETEAESITTKSKEVGTTNQPLSQQPINLTLHISSQSINFTVSRDANIRLEMTDSGSLKLDNSNDPRSLQIPRKMILPKNIPLIDLVDQVYTIMQKSLTNLSTYEQGRFNSKLASLSEWAANPNNTEALKIFIGLEENTIAVESGLPSKINRKIEEETEKKFVYEEAKLDISPEENKAESIEDDLLTEKEKLSAIPTEVKDDISEAEDNEYLRALLGLRKAIENLTYKEKDLDIKVLDEITRDIETLIIDDFDSPVLTNLRNWGINFYKNKQSDPQQFLDDVWQLYAQIMNDPFNIFVIWKANTSFNNNDHVVDGNSLGLDYNTTVTRVIEPGFKVSARVRDKQNRTIRKAHVQIAGRQG